MSAGVAADSVLDSETIDLTSVGAVSFTAETVARETSTGSNFESTDRFKAELIIDGTAIPVIPSTIDVGDGALSPAVNGPPNGFINGYTGTPDEADYNTNVDRDEFNTGREVADTPLNNVINLSGSIPASANSVLLRITGAGVTGTEALIVRNVLFSPGAVSNDTDGDGESNTDEAIAGTNPDDPTDVLRLTSNPATPNVISFPTKADRFYRVYVSDDASEPTHLTVWKDAGLGTMTLAGNGNPAQFNITVTPGETRRFYRIHVMQTDGVGGVWPATYP